MSATSEFCDQPIRERIEKNMKYPNLNSPGAGSESTKSSSSIQRLNLNPNWKNTPMIVAMVGLPGESSSLNRVSARLKIG